MTRENRSAAARGADKLRSTIHLLAGVIRIDALARIADDRSVWSSVSGSVVAALIRRSAVAAVQRDGIQRPATREDSHTPDAERTDHQQQAIHFLADDRDIKGRAVEAVAGSDPLRYANLGW